MKYLIIIVFILIMSNILFAGTRHANVSDQSVLHNSNLFDSVVQVVIEKGVDKYRASGVIIAKHHILTAAHVVYKQDPKNTYILYNHKKYKVIEIHCHPDFQNKFHHDIAIVKILGFIDIKYPELNNQKNEVGKMAYLGGYGASGTGDIGYNTWDFKLRIGTNVVEYISGDCLMCTLSRNNYSKYEFITCPGDSGGGLFIDNKLAGINSTLYGNDRGSRPIGRYGDTSGHTRISEHVEWIRKYILY